MAGFVVQRLRPTPKVEFRGSEIWLKRDDVDGQSAQTYVLVTIGHPVPIPEQTRVDGVSPIEDVMTPWIAHDVQQQQACGGLRVLEGIHRHAITGPFVRR